MSENLVGTSFALADTPTFSKGSINEINIQILEHRNKINELIILKRKMIIDRTRHMTEPPKKEPEPVNGFEFFKELFKAFDDNQKGINTNVFTTAYKNSNP